MLDTTTSTPLTEPRVLDVLGALAHPLRLKGFRALVVTGPAGPTPAVMHEGLDVPAATLSFPLTELARADSGAPRGPADT